MPRLFFDTSALIKLYHEEEGTDIVDNILSQDRSAVIIISDITLIEMVSTFAKKVRTHVINEGTFITVVALQLASAMAVNKQNPVDLFIAADKTLLAVAEQASLSVLLV